MSEKWPGLGKEPAEPPSGEEEGLSSEEEALLEAAFLEAGGQGEAVEIDNVDESSEQLQTVQRRRIHDPSELQDLRSTPAAVAGIDDEELRSDSLRPPPFGDAALVTDAVREGDEEVPTSAEQFALSQVSALGLADPDLQIDGSLLEQIEDIVARREHTLTLVHNAETRRDQVKTDIFQRVVVDYQEQLRSIEEEYNPVSHSISKALQEISRREVALRREQEEVNDVMVEMRFRCEVGEFSEEDLFPIEAENTRKLKELNGRLAIISATYETCQRLLRPEEFDSAVRTHERSDAALEIAPDDIIHEVSQVEQIEVDGFAPPDSSGVFSEDVGDALLSSEPHPLEPSTGDPDVGSKRSFEPWTLGDEAPSTMAEEEPPSEEGRVRCYIVLKTEAGEEESYPLGLEAFAIGRHPKNDMVLTDRGISRRHGRIILEANGSYSVTDLSSGNGIFLNGERVSGKAELSNGDHIVMGNCQLCYVERLE